MPIKTDAQPNKGGGGGFEAGDSSGKRGSKREASGFKPSLARASHGMPSFIAVKNRSHNLQAVSLGENYEI
jgi:hypothetical protein